MNELCMKLDNQEVEVKISKYMAQTPKKVASNEDRGPIKKLAIPTS